MTRPHPLHKIGFYGPTDFIFSLYLVENDSLLVSNRVHLLLSEVEASLKGSYRTGFLQLTQLQDTASTVD